MRGHISKGRKRNKSSPLLQSSPKKNKPLKTHKICLAEVTAEETVEPAEHDSLNESLTLLKTPVSIKPSDTNNINTPPGLIMQGPEQTLQSEDPSGITSELASTQIPPPSPSMMNPLIFSDQYAMSNRMFTQFQQPVMPALSEHDITRIAHAVKSMLNDEISQLVQAKVSSATASLRTELDDLKQKYNSLKGELDSLQRKQGDTEQYSRRMCLRLPGIPETQNEDANKVLLDFAMRLNANIGPSDIDRAHRMGRSNEEEVESDTKRPGARPSQIREIIIKFTNSDARLNLLRGCAKLLDDNVRNIFINEDLTPFRKLLAY